MANNPFLYFLSLDIFSERGKHSAVIILSMLLIFLLAATLFISSSLQYSLRKALIYEPDFSVYKTVAGRMATTPLKWEDELLEINGISKVTPRVFGRYYVEAKGKSFLVMGVDFLDENAHRSLEKLIGKTDLKSFLKGDAMIAGAGAAAWLKSHFYTDSYNFISPSGSLKKVKIFKVLPQSDDLFASDMLIMPIETAREIFGMGENESTDIVFNVPNDDEWDTISDKVSALHYNLRVVDKREIKKAYDRLFNYKGGFFLVLFLISLLSFVLILYQRYLQVYSHEKRSIGILRALGWSIKDVLKLKFFETLSVVIAAFILGTVIAYFYVFALGAPLLKEIFLGGVNLELRPVLIPTLDISILASIFLLYAIPFIAAVLIPVWKIAVTDPKEAML